MSDSKISALPASTTPLAGTEVLPIVQSGTTKKVAVSDLTVGRAVSGVSFTGTSGASTFPSVILNNSSSGVNLGTSSGNLSVYSYVSGTVILDATTTGVTIPNGNLVIGTSGNGISFSADSHASGMTSELLDDYEEGTFTPTVLGSSTAGTANYTVQVGRYTKVGNRVYISGRIVYNTLTGTGNLLVDGLPFAVANISNNYSAISLGDINGLTLTALNTPFANTVINAARFEFTQTPVGGGTATAVPVDAAASFMFAGHYEA